MSKKAAFALETKILNAIERGEFTPEFGYLKDHTFTYVGSDFRRIEIGPCGCAIAAAATVNGIDADSPKGEDVLIAYLKTVGLDEKDSRALENGYEANARWSSNPYFFVGKRLRRFHPGNIGKVE